MRSFIMLIGLTAAFLTGCASDDDNCTQTSGCTDPNKDAGVNHDGNQPENCGDGVCMTEDGETADNCSMDCSGVCEEGRVYCEASGGEQIACNDPWTDCSLPVMVCGGGPRRCPSEGLVARCCDSGPNMTDVFFCPTGEFYCPNAQSCVPDGTPCAFGQGNSCYYQPMSCDAQ